MLDRPYPKYMNILKRQELKKQKDIIEKMAEIVYGKETMTGEEFKKEFENINKTGSE